MQYLDNLIQNLINHCRTEDLSQKSIQNGYSLQI